MSRETTEKLLVSVVLIAWYICMPQVGYTGDMESPAHLTYMLSHANIWHLAGNVFVLWMMRGRLHLLSVIAIAFLASFIPSIGSVWDGFAFDGQTMGFSGAIFAIAGIQWGRYIWRQNNNEKQQEATKAFLTKALPWAIVGVLIPHINWSLHLYCMMAGFIYGRCRR